MQRPYDKLYGECAQRGECDCGVCYYVDPDQTPDYKATNQASRYKTKLAAGMLFPPETPGKVIGYKDPLEPIEGGWGFFGAIKIDEETNTCVQCYICGFYLQNLGMHIKEHNIGPKEYKKRYGLHISKPLMSAEGSTSWKRKHGHNYTPEHQKQVRGIQKLAKANQKPSERIGKDKRPLAWYNQFGLCPVQVIDKYFKLEKKSGKVPGIKQYAKEYTWGAAILLKKQFGSWDEVKYQLSGVVPDRQQYQFEDTRVNTAWLQAAEENQERLQARAVVNPLQQAIKDVALKMDVEEKVDLVEHFGLAERIFRVGPAVPEWTHLSLTDKGKKALGRPQTA